MNGVVFYRSAHRPIPAGSDPRNRHSGVDIAADPDESILAALDGAVIFSGCTSDDVQLRHTGSFLKSTDYKVKAGEAIAPVGNTGGQPGTGTHPHFELWHRGGPLNTRQYIEFLQTKI